MQNFKKILSSIAIMGACLTAQALERDHYLQPGTGFSTVPGFTDQLAGSPQYQNYLANNTESRSFNVGARDNPSVEMALCNNRINYMNSVEANCVAVSDPQLVTCFNNAKDQNAQIDLAGLQAACADDIVRTYPQLAQNPEPTETEETVITENNEDINCMIGTSQAGQATEYSVYPMPAASCAEASGRPISSEEITALEGENCLAAPIGGVRVLNSGTNAGVNCGRMMTALGARPTAPIPQPGAVADADSLNFVSCSGVKGTVDLQVTEAVTRSDVFDFSGFQEDINANQNQTLAEQGNEADGYFFKSDLLVACENLGTEPWGEFRNRVNTPDTWKASWRTPIRDMIGVESDSGQSSPGVIDGVSFTTEEEQFLKRCTGPNKAKLAKADVSNSEKYKTLIGKVKRVATNGINIMNAHRKLTEKCEALVYLTDRADYGAEYPMTAGSMKTQKKSFDGRITCEAYGAETQDYKACKTFVNTYDASMVAKTALNAGQGIHYQGQTMDRQAEMTRQGQTGGIDHRGALGAQKDDIKDRAGYATQTAVLDSAKLAALFAQLQAMPTRAKLKEECSASLGSNLSEAEKRVHGPHEAVFNKFLAALSLDPSQHFQNNCIAGDTAGGCENVQASEDGNTSIIPSNKITAARDAASLCNAVVSSARGSARDEATSSRARARTASSRSRRRGGSERTQEASMSGAASLIMNDAMRSVAKQILAQTAVEAAASFMKAGMLNKQAKTIDELLKKIEGYDPSGDFVPPNTDLLAGPCAFDPSAEGCGAGVPLAARQVGFGSNSLSFGNGGFGSSGTNLDADTGFDNAAGDGTGSSDRSGASGPVGSLITGIDKPSGFEGGVPGAASIKSSAAQRSGGGGGGASAVGSTGGSAGGGSGGGAKGGAASGGKKLDYAGSSIGRLSGGRGVGRKPASKDAGANPFANMFKKGGPQNGTLNFRNPAGIGNKAGNIFDQISERYQVVQGKNLLLEYEEKK
ncbi:MAG: hypothetical protein ACN6I6_01965 [bacterium]